VKNNIEQLAAEVDVPVYPVSMPPIRQGSRPFSTREALSWWLLLWLARHCKRLFERRIDGPFDQGKLSRRLDLLNTLTDD
jgi:hypothetical protein